MYVCMYLHMYVPMHVSTYVSISMYLCSDNSFWGMAIYVAISGKGSLFQHPVVAYGYASRFNRSCSDHCKVWVLFRVAPNKCTATHAQQIYQTLIVFRWGNLIV